MTITAVLPAQVSDIAHASAILRSDPGNLDGLRPHKYQEEVFKRAQNENIIAALGTGTGKTLISVLLIKWISSQPKNKNKPVVFLVPKVALADQQSEYIRRKTGLKVLKLHGALDLDLADRRGWQKRFRSHGVVVMTPQVFVNIITHSLWGFDHISLLVFDECHHARKHHPYNIVMREYSHVPPSKRPKVFGMTASPIWEPKKAQESLEMLEGNMYAKVIGVRENAEELRERTSRPNEVVKGFPYPQEHYDYPTPTLHQCLHVLDPAIWQYLDFPWSKIEIRYYSTESILGPYPASMFLYLEVQDHVERFLIAAKQESRLNTASSNPSYDNLPGEFGILIDILTDFAPFFPSSISDFSIPVPVPLAWCTPKVKSLVEILLEYYTPSFQGIIFVEQRQTASCLARLLHVIPELNKKIKAAHLVGNGVNSEGVGRQTDVYMGDPVALFRKKEINILVATSVAEEGLDFPACDLVVRFDPFQHMVGYLQSRGRARNKASRFIVMIQENDEVQMARYKSFQEKEASINEVYQTRHQILVEQDKEPQDDNEDCMDTQDLAARERYVIPSTGAVLSYDNALTLLANMCALIPRDPFTPLQAPRYIEGFQTRLELPSTLPLARADLHYTGPFRNTKKEAKRAVAFMAVKSLHTIGVFDDYLLPVERNVDDDSVDDGFRLGKEKKRIRIPEKLQVAVRDPWGVHDPLWIHPLVVDGRCETGMVVGRSLPAIDFSVSGARVQLLKGRKLCLDPQDSTEQRAIMEKFTTYGIFNAITARPLSHPSSFYFVPLLGKPGCEPSPDYPRMQRILDYLPLANTDWSAINEDTRLFDEILVLSRLRAGGVFRLRAVRHDLSPLSSPQSGLPESPYSTYHEYWTKAFARTKYTLDIPKDGPLIEVEKLSRLNTGSYHLRQSGPRQEAVQGGLRLLPQNACAWVPFSMSLRCAFQTLPALCHRITHNHLALSAKTELGIQCIPLELVIEALTIPSTSFPHSNQRLETLGDAVLQVCSTVHLYSAYPHRHEGQLTALRKKCVSNMVLMNHALRVGLDRFVISEHQSVHTWPFVQEQRKEWGDDLRNDDLPSMRPTLPRGTVEKLYPRRSLQDCVEALLGAAYLSGGIPLALRVGTCLGLEFGGLTPWFMRYPQPTVAGPISSLFNGLEDKLGYKFRRNALLVQALTHPSFVGADQSYQRLEFLGDAVLDLVVVDYLYKKFPSASSFQLHHPRAKVICNQTLAYIAVRELGLHQLMMYQSSELDHLIDQYTSVFNETTPLEIVQEGWRLDPPKALGDIFESVVGAVFVDSGFNYDKTAVVVENVMDNVLKPLSTGMAKDPVSELCEWVTKNGCMSPVQFKRVTVENETRGPFDVEREGIVVVLHDTTLGKPTVRPTLAAAKFAAAQSALDTLKETTGGPDSTTVLDDLCKCSRTLAAPDSVDTEVDDILARMEEDSKAEGVERDESVAMVEAIQHGIMDIV